MLLYDVWMEMVVPRIGRARRWSILCQSSMAWHDAFDKSGVELERDLHVHVDHLVLMLWHLAGDKVVC